MYWALPLLLVGCIDFNGLRAPQPVGEASPAESGDLMLLTVDTDLGIAAMEDIGTAITPSDMSSGGDPDLVTMGPDMTVTAPFCATGIGTERFIYNGHCYTFFGGTPNRVTWTVADTNCRALPKSHLVHYANATELDAVMNKFKPGVEHWTSLTDQATEGTFVWLNGETDTFRNWALGEPSNSNPNEDCVEVYGHPNGTWNDESCTNANVYICEQDSP